MPPTVGFLTARSSESGLSIGTWKATVAVKLAGSRTRNSSQMTATRWASSELPPNLLTDWSLHT